MCLFLRWQACILEGRPGQRNWAMCGVVGWPNLLGKALTHTAHSTILPSHPRSLATSHAAPLCSFLLPSAATGVHFTNIVSQSDVVSFLDQHAAQLGPALLGTSLEGLGLRPRSVVAVPSDMPAIHAFRAVRDSGVGCAGVVELHRWGGVQACLCRFCLVFYGVLCWGLGCGGGVAFEGCEWGRGGVRRERSEGGA